MLYIFDFDYTLFDTARFKHDYFEQFQNLVYEPQDLRLENFKENVIHYNIKDHLELLGDNLRDHGVAEKALDKFLSDLRKYLFLGAKELIIKLKKSNHRLILMSLGNVEFQTRKISGSGIEDLFDQIIITPNNKELSLRQIDFGKGSVIIVNDNFEESSRMMKTIGKAQLFLIGGPYSDNKQNLENYELNKIFDLTA